MGIFSKREFIEWEDYKKHIDMLDSFWWRQSVRRKNIV